MHIQILYGTETGTAEMLSHDMQDAFAATHACDVNNLESIAPDQLSSDCLYIVVCSTYGAGDLPNSAFAFHETLRRDKPDLSAIEFAMFGLGDRQYDDTFAQGSEKLMTALIDCGAQMRGERGLFDASSLKMPGDIAVPWLAQLLGVEIAQPEKAVGIGSKLRGLFSKKKAVS